MNIFRKTIALMSFFLAANCDSVEMLSLDIISYEDFIREDANAMTTLQHAFLEKGIVGIKGVPGYQEKVRKFVETARAFYALSKETKEAYAPRHDLGETFIGYENGKEKFQRPDGRWVVDTLKASYYITVPDSEQNKWPHEMELKKPFLDLTSLMAEMGDAVMQKIGLIGPKTGIPLDGILRWGRMLYYRKETDSTAINPFWGGAHFDNGIFTVLCPATYFMDGKPVPEPIEAGLFIQTKSEESFKKVAADNPDVMLFQIGEFAQLMTNDATRATKHRVHKAKGPIERYTLALFYSPAMDTVVRSFSELAQDARYGALPGEPSTYRRWYEESFKLYLVK